MPYLKWWYYQVVSKHLSLTTKISHNKYSFDPILICMYGIYLFIDKGVKLCSICIEDIKVAYIHHIIDTEHFFYRVIIIIVHADMLFMILIWYTITLRIKVSFFFVFWEQSFFTSKQKRKKSIKGLKYNCISNSTDLHW